MPMLFCGYGDVAVDAHARAAGDEAHAAARPDTELMIGCRSESTNMAVCPDKGAFVGGLGIIPSGKTDEAGKRC